MNEPSGFTLDSAGNITSVDPWGVIFNKAMPLQSLHMIVAAYVVGGFLIASVYAMGMLRGRRDRYHRLGFLIPFTVAIVFSPIQMVVGDALARWVYNNQPVKFAAIELVPEHDERRPRDAVRPPQLGRDRDRRHPDPGSRLVALGPEHGKNTVVQGLNTVPAENQPTIAEVNVVHLSWDIMVGLGTFLVLLLGVVLGCRGCSAGTCRRAAGSCGSRRPPGCSLSITMEAGWIVSEVGRQPWIVYNLMKVEDAATGNTGVWLTFLGVFALYIAVAVTTILVLRR